MMYNLICTLLYISNILIYIVRYVDDILIHVNKRNIKDDQQNIILEEDCLCLSIVNCN